MAFEVLLDITGQFRLHDANDNVNVSSRLEDSIIEMTMAGRAQDAIALRSLSSPVIDKNSSSALLVLLLCSRHIRKRKHWLSSSFFGMDRLIPSQDDNVTQLDPYQNIPRLFSDSLVIESSLRETAATYAAANKSPIDRADCIAEAARFTEEQYTLWKQNQLSDAPIQKHHNQRSRHQADLTTRFLAFVKADYDHARSKYKRISVPPPTPIMNPRSEMPARDNELLNFVLAHCVCGADVDTLSANMVGERTPLAETLLQECDSMEARTRIAQLDRANRTSRRRNAVRANVLQRSCLADELTHLMTRATAIGSVYRDITSFTDAYASAGTRRTLHAVTDFTFSLARAYFNTILEAAGDDHIPACNRASSVVHTAEAFVADACIVADSLQRIEQTDGTAVPILNILLDESLKHVGNECVQLFFYTALTPYFENVWDWVFEGTVRRDLHGEFFGTVLGVSPSASEHVARAGDVVDDRYEAVARFPDIFTEGDALFLLRAGRSRDLLRHFAMHEDVLSERPSDVRFGDLNVSFVDVKKELDELADRIVRSAEVVGGCDFEQRIGPEKLDVGVGNEHFSDGDEELSRSGSCMHLDDPRDIDKSLLSPTCVRCTAFRIPVVDSVYKTLSNNSDNGMFTSVMEQESKERNLSLQVVMPPTARKPRFPCGTMLTSQLLAPLRRIDAIVQRKVLHFCIHDMRVFDHLFNLRSHVLLGAGDFANELVDQLESASYTSDANERYIHRRRNAAMTFYGGGGAGEKYVRDRAHLNGCLKTALNLYSAEGDTLADLLHLECDASGWTNAERRLSGGQSSLWESTMTMDMKYDVDYPLNIIVTEGAMGMYSKMFGLFLRVLRAKKSLRSMFMSWRRMRTRRNEDTRIAKSVWQFCWHAEHFVSIFGGFEMDQVLGGSWHQFESCWTSVCSLWELRDEHVRFLESCIRRCLLNEKHKSVLKVMTGGFEIVVNIDREVAKLDVDDVVSFNSNAKNVLDLLASATSSLKRRCAFLTDVLERLLEGGSLPHLQHLLTRLNFNHYYQKQHK